jgi:pimeloyl-ACP methyl ester carboxylesterase
MQKWILRAGVIVIGLAVTSVAVKHLAGAYIDAACHTPLLVRFTPIPLSRHCAFPQSQAADVARARSVLHIRSADDVASHRRALNTLLWRGPETPRDLLPTVVRRDIDDPRVAGLPNLDHTDEFATSFPFGFVGRGYHLVPVHGNGRLMVYCEGHEGSFTDDGREKVAALLAAGFAVLAFDMPMRGINDWPSSIVLPSLGEVPFGSRSHWNLALLESSDFLPLRLFVEPILRALNQIERTRHYDLVAMLGLSGGGWVTTIYAALDPRITRSYPVAGSLPFFLWEEHPISHRHEDEGDYEQRLPALFGIAGHLDLYVMGASGPGRRQVQILNRYDPCCFFGTRARAYAPLVAEAVSLAGNGGEFRLVIDQTHEQHAISAHALGLILEDASAPWCQEGTAECEGELIAEGPTGPAYDRWSAVE